MKKEYYVLVAVAGIYTWAKLMRIDDETYSIPLYICQVLYGKHKNEVVAACQYYRIFNI